ncbi:MAG: heavy-metal-associated domain-containing protein [Caldilineae bacterium]|nr:heavy-metal-associated domain-containing protein [Chloroflexota bacterium]MCB9176619.1 heavy-metal-associated domain-containing protein [Caldilineae bacterium]
MSEPNITQRFSIQGMHCSSCAMSIDWELEDLPGVAKATTSYARATTEVTFDPHQTSLETLLSAIERAGFKGLPA